MTTDTVPAPTSPSKRSGGLGTVTYVCACVAAVLTFVAVGPSAKAVVGAFLAVVLVVLAAIDLERRVIPNNIVLPASAIVLLANIAIRPSHAVEFLVAGAAAFAVFFVVALINPAGLGMGDVKLAFLLGAGLGWDVAAALILGTFGAAIYGVFIVLTRPGAGAKTAFPLGPFLAGGAIVVLLLSH